MGSAAVGGAAHADDGAAREDDGAARRLALGGLRRSAKQWHLWLAACDVLREEFVLPLCAWARRLVPGPCRGTSTLFLVRVAVAVRTTFWLAARATRFAQNKHDAPGVPPVRPRPPGCARPPSGCRSSRRHVVARTGRSLVRARSGGWARATPCCRRWVLRHSTGVAVLTAWGSSVEPARHAWGKCCSARWVGVCSACKGWPPSVRWRLLCPWDGRSPHGVAAASEVGAAHGMNVGSSA